jgi:hypothetical protein
MTAKSAPSPPCTVTAFWLKYQDPARMLRRVTQPPHIAGPLGLRDVLSDRGSHRTSNRLADDKHMIFLIWITK